MPDVFTPQDRDATRLSAAQRDWIRRQARVARALEASQRRASGRFRRDAPAPPRMPRDEGRVAS